MPLRAAISGMENPLGRNRMLCRGEFGAAVFEKRRSIRFRRADMIVFQDGLSCLSFAKQNLTCATISGLKNPLVRIHMLCPSRVRRSRV